MTFWTYMIQCGDRTFYVGHTNNMEQRFGEHQTGTFKGYTSTRPPLHLVWSQEFPSRQEALEAERRLKGWSKAKKLALIRGDWDMITALARGRREEGRASTSSAQTERGKRHQENFLHPHPARLPSEPFSVEGTVRAKSNRLDVQYIVNGPVRLLDVPAPASSARRDELWKHTCFEVFALTADGYLEYNLSPSSEWAAYRFSGYRENMTELDVQAPRVAAMKTGDKLKLRAELVLPTGIELGRLGLSAVIEELDGTKSYWALRHPPGDKPDFHHPDCFALELPPAREA